MRALTALLLSLLPLLGAVGGPAVPDVTIPSDAPGLARVNGVLRYRGEPFSGHVVERAGEAVLARTPYLQGREHGLAEAYHPGGRRRYERSYELGRREGTHRAFWPNGQVQSVHHYKADLLEGEQVAFHENGREAELRHYRGGREEGVQRLRDPEGRIVANYTFRRGRRYGIVGRFDCISMVGE
jgi:antitoxin component YwqK of YwqJK toxin-antitoxin module